MTPAGGEIWGTQENRLFQRGIGIFPCIENLASLGDQKNQTLTGQALVNLLESINFTVGLPISVTIIASSLKL